MSYEGQGNWKALEDHQAMRGGSIPIHSVGWTLLNIIHQNCDPELANDRSLPHTAYLVEYDDGNKVCYDIAVSSKRVEIFDYYWDKYRNVISLKQSEGRTNPKLWQDPRKKKK